MQTASRWNSLIWSSEIWEKRYASIGFFSYSMFSAAAFADYLLSVHELHQMCMFIVLNIIVYNLWTICYKHSLLPEWLMQWMKHCHPGTHWSNTGGDSDKRTMCLTPSRLVFHWCVKFLSSEKNAVCLIFLPNKILKLLFTSVCRLVHHDNYKIWHLDVPCWKPGNWNLLVFFRKLQVDLCINYQTYNFPNAASHYKIVCQFHPLVRPCSL